MYSFLGNIEAKIDSKGRLFIPFQYRDLLKKNGETEYIVMRKNDERPFLDLYPISVWEKEVASIEEMLDLLDEEDNMFYMQYTSSAMLLKVDDNGRILIPKKYLQEIAIEETATFAGTTNKIALWSKENFDKNMLSAEDFLRLKKEKLRKK